MQALVKHVSATIYTWQTDKSHSRHANILNVQFNLYLFLKIFNQSHFNHHLFCLSSPVVRPMRKIKGTVLSAPRKSKGSTKNICVDFASKVYLHSVFSHLKRDLEKSLYFVVIMVIDISFKHKRFHFFGLRLSGTIYIVFRLKRV